MILIFNCRLSFHRIRSDWPNKLACGRSTPGGSPTERLAASDPHLAARYSERENVRLLAQRGTGESGKGRLKIGFFDGHLNHSRKDQYNARSWAALPERIQIRPSLRRSAIRERADLTRARGGPRPGRSHTKRSTKGVMHNVYSSPRCQSLTNFGQIGRAHV